MPQQIDVPGMGIVEFPDGMSDNEISTAIMRNMQPQQAPQPGKLSRFLTNVYNDPPPSIAAARDAIKGVVGGSMRAAEGDPEATGAVGAAGMQAALLANPINPGSRAAMARIFGGGAPAVPVERPQMPGGLSSAQLGESAAGAYGRAAASGAERAAPAMLDSYNSVIAKLAERFDPTEAPRTFQVLERLAGRVTKQADDPMQALTGVARAEPAAMSGMEIEAGQKLLRAIKGTPEKPRDGAAAKEARALIDEELINAADLPAAYREAIMEGRGDTAAKYRMKGIEAAVERGELGGTEAADRAALRSLVRRPVSGGPSPAQKMGMNEAEISAIKAEANPGVTRDAIMALGRAAPTNALTGAMQGISAAASGGASLPLIPAAFAAKAIGNSKSEAGMRRLMDQVSKRSPAYQRAMRDYQEAVAQAKLAAAAARREFQKSLVAGAAQPLVGTNLPQER